MFDLISGLFSHPNNSNPSAETDTKTISEQEEKVDKFKNIPQEEAEKNAEKLITPYRSDLDSALEQFKKVQERSQAEGEVILAKLKDRK